MNNPQNHHEKSDDIHDTTKQTHHHETSEDHHDTTKQTHQDTSTGTTESSEQNNPTSEPEDSLIHPMQLSKSYSGRFLVILFVVILIGYGGIKLVIGPVLMQKAGVAGDLNKFDVPNQPVTAEVPVFTTLRPLADGERLHAKVLWDDNGVCATVESAAGSTGSKTLTTETGDTNTDTDAVASQSDDTNTDADASQANDEQLGEVRDGGMRSSTVCAIPNSLETLWLIDAPNNQQPGYVLVGMPHGFVSVKIVLTDDTEIEGKATGNDLPAAFALFTLPEGATIKSVQPINERTWATGEAYCGEWIELKEVDGRMWGKDQVALSGGCVVPFDD